MVISLFWFLQSHKVIGKRIEICYTKNEGGEDE